MLASESYQARRFGDGEDIAEELRHCRVIITRPTQVGRRVDADLRGKRHRWVCSAWLVGMSWDVVGCWTVGGTRDEAFAIQRILKI